MAASNRKKVVISNCTLGNVVTGGNIKNLKMYSSHTAQPHRQVNDYCGDTDADTLMTGTVAGNVVLNNTGIENIEMINEEYGTGFSGQRTHEQETCRHPVQEQDTDSNQPYKISSDTRGCVLIIDNLADNNDTNVNRMKDMWMHLGYFPYTCKNLSAEEMKSEVKTFSKKRLLKHTDCIVLMIISNGNGKEFKGSDGLPVSVEELTKNLDATNCKTMLNKPKLMFFEYFTADDVHVDYVPSNIKGRIADTYIVHKISNTQSDINEGSKFIAAIDKVFREGAKSMDIHALMRKVELQIRTEDTLNKLFYF